MDSEAVVRERQHEQLAFIATFKMNPHGPAVLESILDLLHFFDPAENEADMALQNAAKGILHRLGVWGNVPSERQAIVAKILGDR